MEIPLGLRFQPFDYDVLRFLFDFVTGRTSLDDEVLIHQEDVFGENEPWELIPPGKKMAYFLTRLKKKAKSTKGSRVQRTVGRKIMGKKSGNWHGQDTGKAVVDQDGKFLMGYKRSFVYKNKNEPEQDGQWLLKEFYLPVTIIRRARAEFRIVEEREDFVLCYIHPKKEDDDDDDDDEEDDENSLEQDSTSSKDFEAVPVPIPVETSTLQIAEGSNDDDDAINSYFVGVPMETAIVEGVPVETLLAPTDNNNSYIVGIPVDTIAEGAPVETLLAPPAGNTDTVTDGGSYISCGVPVETSSEPNSFMDFNELIWNIEDVVQKTAATFAPRASTASKNPAVPGTTLYTVFEVQGYVSMLLGGALSFNLIFPSNEPDIWRLMGMWSIWMFTIPSLRARDCSKNEKEALNYLFLLIPLLNIIVPFFWKSFAVVWSVDIVAFFGMYAWKVGWLQKQ
nr:protein RESISTANCE TO PHYTOPHTHORA 1, chloroplastic-like [Ipomoea batatas]